MNFLKNKKLIKTAGLAAAIVLTVPISGLVYQRLSGNFHTISRERAYRSLQLNAKQFERIIRKHSIKSVLNLRGKSEKMRKWYTDEIAVCKKLGVKHYDVKLSSGTEPTPADAKEIERILTSAPLPILIHCEGGADRTSLVSAMWEVLMENAGKKTAKRQLRIFYGHRPYGKVQAMDRFFEKWNGNFDTGKKEK